MPPRIRSIAATIALIGGVFLMGACASDDGANSGSNSDGVSDGRRIVTTTSQIGAITREVGGDAVTVKVLLGSGADPHDYEPTAQDMREIGDSALVLRNGIGLDDFLDAAIEGSGSTNVVTVTEGIELRPAGEDDHDEHADEEGDEHAEDESEANAEDEHSEGEFDPHVWHNPANVKLMTANITDALATAFPDQADAFRANGEAYQARMDEVDAEIRGLIDSIPEENRKVVSSHDSFGYFLDRYGLEFIGAVIPTSAGAEASARDIAELQETIEAEGVQAIFAETSVDPAIAEQLASDTGVMIVDDLYGDTLGPEGSGAETVDGMLLHNARRIAEALG